LFRNYSELLKQIIPVNPKEFVIVTDFGSKDLYQKSSMQKSMEKSYYFSVGGKKRDVNNTL